MERLISLRISRCITDEMMGRGEDDTEWTTSADIAAREGDSIGRVGCAQYALIAGEGQK
jgi:hypothetical protein